MLGINRRYFISKKDSVMFSAHMQEVNLNFFIIFNLFYLHFCFGPQVCVGNSSFRICGVLTWRGSVRNTIVLHTHTHTSFFRHTSLKKLLHTTFWQRHSHDTDQPLLGVVPVYRLASSFTVCLSQGGIENLYISLPRQGKSN